MKRSRFHRQYLLEEALLDNNRIRTPDLIVWTKGRRRWHSRGGPTYKSSRRGALLMPATIRLAVDVIARGS
jgi:hypothetical protein